MSNDTIVVADNPSASRYEISVDGVTAGFAEYHLRPGRITFTHTVIADEFEGHGLGSRLAAGALDGARAAGLLVNPLCRSSPPSSAGTPSTSTSSIPPR